MNHLVTNVPLWSNYLISGNDFIEKNATSIFKNRSLFFLGYFKHSELGVVKARTLY